MINKVLKTLVGAGYSKDSQNIVPEVCFTTKGIDQPDVQTKNFLSSPTTFSGLQHELGIYVDDPQGFSMWSDANDTRYMQSIWDQPDSISFNYFSYVNNTVIMDITGYGEQALNKLGQECSHEDFGTTCGDDYVNSFQQGALLLMSVKLSFYSEILKSSFIQAIGGSGEFFQGDIYNITKRIESNYSEFDSQITLQAYQTGGTPDKLATFMDHNQNKTFYSLTCNTTDMRGCTQIAEYLMDYSKSDFHKQFNVKDKRNVVPIGIGFIQNIPILGLGLIDPPSKVEDYVLKGRKKLSDCFINFQYYHYKLKPFRYGVYPVELAKYSNMTDQANLLYKKLNFNFEFLLNPDWGATTCYTVPEMCMSRAINATSRL